jgi:hypothetical protein
MSKRADKLQEHRKPKRLLKSIGSLFIGEIKPFAFDSTFASKPGESVLMVGQVYVPYTVGPPGVSHHRFEP